MAERSVLKLLEGAVGAGLALVVLPSVALFFGMDKLSANPMVGLPILAIFGIMILIGTLALTSTLFQRLGLANPSEALALPTGSVRAAIALALVVLFAIIAIMLFQSLADPQRNIIRLEGLKQADFDAMSKEPRNRILSVQPGACLATAATAPAGSPPSSCYTVELMQGTSQDAIDVAKQLLTLIGTLMTSVTSFYFASRVTATPKPGGGTGATTATTPTTTPPVTGAASAISTPLAQGHGESEDGCDAEISNPTPDEELPPAKGGVA